VWGSLRLTPISIGSEISQSAHVHKACTTKRHGRGLLQKGAGGDQKSVIKFVWPNGNKMAPGKQPDVMSCIHSMFLTYLT